MLGVYDYTVILTYISLMVSIGGMLFSLNGDCRMALVCLAISGLCDMFDGKVARTKKDRTEVEKRFGIQIDSLADIVCFGVSPAILCYRMGMRGLTGVAAAFSKSVMPLVRYPAFCNMASSSSRIISSSSTTAICFISTPHLSVKISRYRH